MERRPLKHVDDEGMVSTWNEDAVVACGGGRYGEHMKGGGCVYVVRGAPADCETTLRR